MSLPGPIAWPGAAWPLNAPSFQSALLATWPFARPNLPYNPPTQLVISDNVLQHTAGERVGWRACCGQGQRDRGPLEGSAHALAEEASTCAGWNARLRELNKDALFAPMDQLTHMQTAERLVPNAGMLVHQGALPLGMRTELANFGNAKELNWGQRWVGDPPGKKQKGKDDEPEGSAEPADKGGGDSESAPSEDEESTDGVAVQ